MSEMPLDKDDAYETFFCSSCGWRVTRLKGSFDMPVCAECRWWDEVDPAHKCPPPWRKAKAIQ
jgi:rubredoxin